MTQRNRKLESWPPVSSSRIPRWLDPVRDNPRFLALRDDMQAELDRQRLALEREGLAIGD
jgi:hypothetical protein